MLLINLILFTLNIFLVFVKYINAVKLYIFNITLRSLLQFLITKGMRANKKIQNKYQEMERRVRYIVMKTERSLVR